VRDIPGWDPYGSCCKPSDPPRPQSLPRTTGNRRHLKGVITCVNSRLYLLLQHSLQVWHWHRRPRHRSSSVSASASNRFVRTDTTTTRPTPARHMAFTARGTSTTESSWAWAPGQAGAMATDGAGIALSAAVAAAIAAAVGKRPIIASSRGAAERALVEAEQCTAAQQSAQAARGPLPDTRQPPNLPLLRM